MTPSASLPARLERACAQLQARCRGPVCAGTRERAALRHDFGGMYERTPALVLRPSCQLDITVALAIAAEHGLPVSTRGRAHCQSGQSLGEGLVLDMTSCARVLRVDPAAGLVEAEAGAAWRDVLDAVFPHGMLPVGLTHALDTTLAGTLSIAGIGAESYRTGPQVDNVIHIDVATFDRGVVRCSLEQNRELFDAVRGGLGQCGVIVRAAFPLRACARLVTTKCYGYASPEPFLRALQLAAADARPGRWLTATAVRDPMRSERSLLLLFVGQEHDADAADAPALNASSDFSLPLRTTPLWDASGRSGHPFFRVFDADGSAERDASALQPWVEHMFSTQDVTAALPAFLQRLRATVGTGTAGVLVLRRGRQPAPLFIVPEGELSVGLGMFARFSQHQRSHAEAVMSEYATTMGHLGGKRYLSGYFPPVPPAQWATHYGGAWAGFQQAKLQFDPQSLLNAGFLHFGCCAGSAR